MKLKEILSEQEIEEYYSGWESFGQKYIPETCYNVHSSIPIIGKVFQFRNKPIFRAHIFKEGIRHNFNPYNPGESYPHTSFHLTHYFYPIEQIGLVGLSKLIEDYHQFIITERFSSKICPEITEKINFHTTHPSIEFIVDLVKGKNRFIGRATASFYEDRGNKILQIWYLEGIGELRAYAECIKKLKQDRNNTEIREKLIRKINMRSRKRGKILTLRKNIPNPDYLIKQIVKGNLPEQELHNYFSDWDKES